MTTTQTAPAPVPTITASTRTQLCESCWQVTAHEVLTPANPTWPVLVTCTCGWVTE